MVALTAVTTICRHFFSPSFPPTRIPYGRRLKTMAPSSRQPHQLWVRATRVGVTPAADGCLDNPIPGAFNWTPIIGLSLHLLGSRDQPEAERCQPFKNHCASGGGRNGSKSSLVASWPRQASAYGLGAVSRRSTTTTVMLSLLPRDSAALVRKLAALLGD